MSIMGLDGRLASVRVRGLSAGQRRRTAFAILVVRRAGLWLLDEPHAGLDSDARDEVDEVLRRVGIWGNRDAQAMSSIELSNLRRRKFVLPVEWLWVIPNEFCESPADGSRGLCQRSSD